MSSATSPGPKISAARACIHTPQDAAARGSMPCAKSPAMTPVSVSPEPAVASQGDAHDNIVARPSGAAVTVSGPL